MNDRDSDFQDDRAQSIARLAALQRLREQAAQGNRTATLEAIDKMIQQEARVLRSARDTDAEPA